MPAKARDLQKAARKLGFQMAKAATPDGSIPTDEQQLFQYMAIVRSEAGFFTKFSSSWT